MRTPDRESDADRACPTCGTAFSSAAAHGLCPLCLLKLGPPGEPAGTAAVREHVPRLGDYELIEEIGRGGMGVVFKARQISLDRLVAIKMILASDLADPELRERFHRESQLAARLRHPNIVSIHEVGREHGRDFFSMDLVESGDLGKMIRLGGFADDRRQIARLAAEISRAIAHAHQAGVLHRDLKPSNILLDTDGHPRLSDFGLARQLAEESPSGLDAALTLTGQTLGSPNYMAPEQAFDRRDRIGPRSDIYSIGAILYEMLTGRPPFVGDSPAAVLLQLREINPVPPRYIDPRIPVDLETICLKCLEKEPDARYNSANALAEDLERFQRGDPVRARRATRIERAWRTARRHPAVSLLGATLALTLIAGILVTVMLEREAQAIAAHAIQERERAEQLLTDLDLDRAEDYFASDQFARGLASLSRALRRSPTNRVVSGRLIGALSRISYPLPVIPPLIHQSGVRNAQFSPDGTWIATISDANRIRLWDARTGDAIVEPIACTARIAHAVFSPDNRFLAYGSGDGLIRFLSVPQGEPAGDPIRHGSPVQRIALDPSGKIMATAGSDGFTRLWLAPTWREILPPIEHTGPVLDVQFSADGQWLASAGTDGSVHCVRMVGTGDRKHPSAGTVAGGPDSAVFEHPRKVMRIAFSPDDSRLLTVCHDGRMRVWDVRTGALALDIPAHSVATSITAAGFDPQGLRIASTSYDRTARLFDARNGRPLCGPLQHDEAPVALAFFGGGEFLATGSRDNRVRLWDARTGNLLGAPARMGFYVASLATSPDGSRLLIASKDRTARVLDLRPGHDLPPILESGAPVIAIDRFPRIGPKTGSAANPMSHDSVIAVTGQRIVRWTPETSVAREIGESLEMFAQVRCEPAGRFVATATRSGIVELWDSTERARLELPAMPHREPVNSLEFNRDGRLLLTAGGAVRIWDSETGRQVSVIRDASRVSQARFHPRHDVVLTASWDSTARLWDPSTGTPLGAPMRHSLPVLSATFDPTGTWIATASRDQTVGLWNVSTSRRAASPLRHRHEVQLVEFDPTGRILASAAMDHDVYLWNIPEGTPATPRPLHHSSQVLDLEFSANGRWLATASVSGEARVWSVSDGHPLTPILRHEHAVSAVRFIANDHRLVTASWNGDLHCFELPVFDDAAPDWLPEFAEAVGGLHLDETGAETFVDHERFTRMKSKFIAVTDETEGDDDFNRWARWFLADRGSRPTSFRSGETTPDFVRERIDAGSRRSLRAALWISPTNRHAAEKLRMLQR